VKYGQVFLVTTLVSAAFIWTKNAGMTSLGTLPGGDASEASDINNAGSVVGFSSIKSAGKHAFLWTSGTGMQDLGTLPGDTNSQAYRINNPGNVIGSSMGPDVTHAFLWTPSGGVQNLGTLGGDSSALDLNNNGDVVGTSTAPMGGTRFTGPAAPACRTLTL
jgi:probable HAF family extracellular repeat protein